MSADRKRVWVTGAGASRSLGGPLLGQLLSEASFDQIRRVYSEVFANKPLVETVYRLYGYGTKYRFGCIEPKDRLRTGGGQDIWQDAEVFLDELDAAADSPTGPLAARIVAIGEKLDVRDTRLSGAKQGELKQLSATARQLVAAECCSFLKGQGVLQTESWVPYRDWGSELGEDDTVITFNYDLVAELAAKHGNQMMTILSDEEVGEARAAKCGQILKLHGSVDWRREDLGNGRFHIRRMQNQPEFALNCPDNEVCIATPGPTKARTAKQLQTIWKLAAEALRTADSIVFLGYRFPPTDAEARKRLLGAIEANEKEHLTFHTVLGENSPDSPRLAALLKSVCERANRGPHMAKKFVINAHPLRAEDFLTVWDPDTV